MTTNHREGHLVHRIGWLRAAILGANDGIVSTSSLIVGVAAASSSDRQAVMVAGLAGLVAGAMSMAAGEYVSVSSQSDTERADLERERRELTADPEGELRELALIYERRGVRPDLALEVARQLSARDPLVAHARDELGISDFTTPRPVQAALTSAATFALGAALPLLAAFVSAGPFVIATVSVVSLLSLAALGAWGAMIGGADILRGGGRILIWGAAAMAATIVVGNIFGAVAG